MNLSYVILTLISLIVAQQNDVIESTNLEADQIKYNEQKLSVKQSKYLFLSPVEIFWVRSLKRPSRWTVNRGNGPLIGYEEFFRITDSRQEQILLKNQIKLSRQQLLFFGISSLLGGIIALAPQTGNAGGYIGGLVHLISAGGLAESRYNSLYPVISFESAKIIAEQYNENLLLKHSNQASH